MKSNQKKSVYAVVVGPKLRRSDEQLNKIARERILARTTTSFIEQFTFPPPIRWVLSDRNDVPLFKREFSLLGSRVRVQCLYKKLYRSALFRQLARQGRFRCCSRGGSRSWDRIRLGLLDRGRHLYLLGRNVWLGIRWCVRGRGSLWGVRGCCAGLISW